MKIITEGATDFCFLWTLSA